MAEIGEFASLLMGFTRTKVDLTRIFTRVIFFTGRRKKRRELIQEGISIRDSLGYRLYVAAGYCDLGVLFAVSITPAYPCKRLNGG